MSTACSGELKIDFQDGSHLGFPNGTILATLIYKLSQYFLPVLSFESNGLSVLERLKQFSKITIMKATLDFPWNGFSYFFIYKLPLSYQGSSQLAFQFRRRSTKLIFNMAAMAAILDIWSEPFSYFLIKSPRYFLPSQLAQGYRSSDLKQIVDVQWRTLTNHNSSPWALPAQVSLKGSSPQY